MSGQTGDPSDFALVRFDVDGSLDTRGLDPHLDAPFGTGGKVTTDFAGQADGAFAVAIELGGKIVVAGISNDDFALARYYVSGSLDPSFGMGGRVTTDFAASGDTGRDIVIQRDGAIVVAGNTGGDFGLTRYLVATCCVDPGAPPGG